MELEQIIDALQKDSNLVESLIPELDKIEAGKKILENRTNVEVEKKIGERVKTIYDQIDNDVFSILGEKPGTDENGQKKEKTYDFIKRQISEFKSLKDKATELEKDPIISKLKQDLEKAKSEGSGALIKQELETAKQQWLQREEELKNQLATKDSDLVNFKKNQEIELGIATLKFNPDIPKSVVDIAVNSAKTKMLNSSEIREGKLVFLDESKNVKLGQKYEPMTPIEFIESLEEVKDILLKDGKKGGGADKEIKGHIETKKVEGKDDEIRLIIPEGAIKTKQQFIEVTEKLLLEEGITRTDKRWQILIDNAYKDLEVAKMPRS